MAFRVQQIDHVELFVPNRDEAAAWLERVLGLEIDPACRHWAEHPLGPLMVTTPEGGTKIALFQGEPQGKSAPVGIKRIAFRADAAGFSELLARLEEHALTFRGRPVSNGEYTDHDGAWSIYFDDPWGNPFEVTTYEVGAR